MADKILTIGLALFRSFRIQVLLLIPILFGNLMSVVHADVPPEAFAAVGQVAERESGLAGERDPTLSASALNPLSEVRRDYLAVFGILAASVFLSLRKRPHRLAPGGR